MRNNKLKNVNLGTYSIYIMTIAVFILLSVSRANFFNFQNIYSLIFGLSMEYLPVIGMTLLMISGELDLSIGSIFAFSGILSIFFMLKLGMPVLVGILLSLLVAAIIGYINGFLVVRLKANSIMVTIGSMILFRGIADTMTQNLSGISFPPGFISIISVKISKIHITVIIMIILLIFLEFLLKKNISLKNIYYIGENILSARVYGIRVQSVKHILFIISSILAGLSGILALSRLGSTTFNVGQGLEFKMITAAILGGASLYGGKGSIAKSFFGLLLLALIANGIIMFNINPNWTNVVTGLVLILAISVDARLNTGKL